MAISTYAELVTALENWSDRTDADLAARLPECITLGEVEIFRRLRVRQMETTASSTPNANGEITLPADMLEIKRVTAKTDPRRRLKYVTSDYADSIDARVSGDPNIYFVVGDTLTVLPFTSSDIEVTYYAKVTPLSAVATTNWLLSRWPDIYLQASLAQFAILAKDSEAAGGYMGLMNNAIDRAMNEDIGARMGPVAMRVEGPVW